MFGKKRLNGRIRRRIRKTTAVVLLITSIVVAAIPVPGAEAANPSVWATDSEEVVSEAQQVTNSVVAQSDGKGKIPWVSATEPIYTYYQGKSVLKFAYPELPGEGRKAILLGRADNETSDFEIPGTLKAYMKNSSNKDVAANERGDQLFYKKVTKRVYERTHDPVSSNNPSAVPPDSSSRQWTNLEPAAVEELGPWRNGDVGPSVYANPAQYDEARNKWVQKVYFYTYMFTPCLRTEEGVWYNDGDSTVVRYIINGTGGAASTQFYCIPTEQQFQTAGMQRSNLTDVLNSSYTENKTNAMDGNGSFKQPSSKEENWLEYAEVAYISDQSLDPATGKAGASRGVQGYFLNDIVTLGLPNSLKMIADYSFYQTNLEEIWLPTEQFNGKPVTSKLADIGKYAFAKCNQMEVLPLDDMTSLKVISDHMFEGCANLKNIKVSNTITTIGDFAFAECTQLQTIDFSGAGNLKKFGNYVFRGCEKLQGGGVSFEGVSFQTGMSLPESLEEIGWYNFENCKGLKIVKIGGNKISQPIRFNNFKGCKLDLIGGHRGGCHVR